MRRTGIKVGVVSQILFDSTQNQGELWIFLNFCSTLSRLNTFIPGFLLQASLIVALGAQNLFVLDSALLGNRPYLVAFVCFICDLVLVTLGVLGAGSLFVQVPLLKLIFGVLGVLFLFYYGALKLKDAFFPKPLTHEAVLEKRTARDTVARTLGFSLLNPHVYLDTLVLIGGYSSRFPNAMNRFVFGMGASFCSLIWFFGLVVSAVTMKRFMKSDRAFRLVALISGMILIALAFQLGLEVIHHL